jgi:hypothetical protein
MACNLLSRYVRQNGAAAVDLGLGINKGEQGGLWIFRLLFRALILSWGRYVPISCDFFFVSPGRGGDFLRDLCSRLDFRSIWPGISRQAGLLESRSPAL